MFAEILSLFFFFSDLEKSPIFLFYTRENVEKEFISQDPSADQQQVPEKNACNLSPDSMIYLWLKCVLEENVIWLQS